MGRDRAERGLELCRAELRKACASRNRTAAHYWALQLRDNREWLKRYVECERPEWRPLR